MIEARTLRWAPVFVYAIANMLNFLDRMTLAALAPILMKELSLSGAQYGIVLSAFSLAYAFCAPFAGVLIDRIGLNRGIAAAVALWSAAGAATGWVTGFGNLLVVRALLGVCESAALPGSAKVSGTYMNPAERPVGAAFSQAGLSGGALLAPLLSLWIANYYGWRAVFVITGAIGFLWIPLWWAVIRIAPKADVPPEGAHSPESTRDLFRHPVLWTLVAANFLSLVVYALWTNWTTVYLVREHGLTTQQALKFSWVPPLCVSLGGVIGGILGYRGVTPWRSNIEARLRVCRLAACVLVTTALVPLTTTPLQAVLAIGLSFFWSGCWNVNLYTLPVDLFGPRRAAASVGAITFAFGSMQALVSPIIGRVVDLHGFQPVCVSVSILPLLAYAILSRGLRKAPSLSPAAA